MKIVRSALLVLALCAAARCEEMDPCSGGNLVTLDPPTEVESVEIRDEHQILWRIQSPVPRKLEVLHYGEVPAGFQQVFPPGSARPRPFVKGESLHKQTITRDRVIEHDGQAGSESSFCGGYYESAPRTKT